MIDVVVVVVLESAQNRSINQSAIFFEGVGKASSRCCCCCEFLWTIQIPRYTFDKKFAAKPENCLSMTVAKASGESPGSLTGFYRTTPESVSNDAWKFNRFFIERR